MLKGKSAIITGGVRGIGKAVAEEFCKSGAGVVLCFKDSVAAAEETLKELSASGSNVELLQGDVSDPEFAKEAVKRAKEVFGSVDILVNNAGITNDKLLIKMTEDDFKNVIDTNLNGAFYFLKEASLVMIKQRYGRIINMSSVAGVRGSAGQINYSASKAGVIGMTLAAAKELGRRGITVNAIAPGYVDTDMTAVLTQEQKDALLSSVSLGRAGSPHDIAKTALFLASEDACYITGQVICVDGGMGI